MKEILIVGIGGFAGSVSRYLLQNIIVGRFITIFPLGTFAINLIGSFAIGLIFGIAERYEWMNQEWRLFLAIGFCGSFTTFSTFAFDNLQLIKDGNYQQLVWYTVLSFILGVALAAVGYILVKN
ncbi:MAG: fluoride efflux transporter CrcB [Bacteroidota bacterium]